MLSELLLCVVFAAAPGAKEEGRAQTVPGSESAHVRTQTATIGGRTYSRWIAGPRPDNYWSAWSYTVPTDTPHGKLHVTHDVPAEEAARLGLGKFDGQAVRLGLEIEAARDPEGLSVDELALQRAILASPGVPRFYGGFLLSGGAWQHTITPRDASGRMPPMRWVRDWSLVQQPPIPLSDRGAKVWASLLAKKQAAQKRDEAEAARDRQRALDAAGDLLGKR